VAIEGKAGRQNDFAFVVKNAMLKFHTNWRLQLARRLAGRIRAFDGVQAIIVGGSVARGYADAYSDLELALFWDALPDDDARQALVAALGATFLRPYDGPAREDQLLINDFQVDLWHQTVAHEEGVLRAVMEGYSTDLGDSNFMDTVRACIPLYGEAIIRDWKERAAAYPDGLAVRNIREHVVAFDTSQLALLAHRDNPSVFYAQVCHLQQAVFLVLLALNGQYFPTYKWMYRAMEALPVKPPNVSGRFRRAFKTPYAEAIADTTRVLHETLDLVAGRYPQIDTGPVRRRLEVTRTAHDKPVEL
jgi:predicted nucleotidyltransferase